MSHLDCMKFVICKEPSEECFLRNCDECPASDSLCDYIVSAWQNEYMDTLTYKQWISKPRTTLTTCLQDPIEFAQDLCEKLKDLVPHNFIAGQQASFLKAQKESLGDDEFLVISDFAENYAFVIQNAAPGFHWNNNSATIYPAVIYYRQNGDIVHQSLVIISDCLSHDAVEVFVFSKISNEFIQSICQNPKKVFHFSDGAPPQFKNFKNFINVYSHETDFGVPAERHFLLRHMVKVPATV